MRYPLIAQLSFGLLFLLIGCQPNATLKVHPEEIGNYIDAYSSGRISVADPLQIRLAKPYFSAGEDSPELDPGLIKISPKIKGSLSWASPNTIQFNPVDRLESNKTYRAKVNLKILFPNIEKNLSSFDFEITTREQFMNLETGSISSVSNGVKQKISGSISTADIAASTIVEQTLSAKLSEELIEDIVWEHSSSGLNHRFEISDLPRIAEGQKLKLQISGMPLGTKDDYVHEVYIPGLDEFKVMDLVFRSGENKFISIKLSDPVASDQELKGLISIDGYEDDLRFLKDGNDINVYWTKQIQGAHRVKIASQLKNSRGKKLLSDFEKEITFDTPKPQLRLIGNGVIIPSADGFAFPFEAINLNAVDVEIFKIFNNNILQYFQNNDYSGDYNLRQVGRIISHKKVELGNQENEASQNRWSRYALDLSEMINDDPEAIYQIRIGFKAEHTNYPCSKKAVADPNKSEVNAEQYKSFWEDNYYGYRGYYNGYSWKQREDPCFDAYYNSEKFIARNVIASDMGIVGKKGNDGSVFLALTNLVSLDPVAGAKITFFDYQNQEIQTGRTDAEGQLRTELSRAPFLIMAEHNQNRGYLKMADNNSMSLSKFEVAGVKIEKGMKGYIYGERGVWRPGDTLFLNFMLEKTGESFPEDLPVKINLFNPKNQLVQSKVNNNPVGGIYHFQLKTHPDDLTGNYRAEVLVGGTKFSKTLKIETIKPNRLKIEIDMKSGLADDGQMEGTLNSRWLHGALAKNLKARVETQLKNSSIRIPKYSGFSFHDPSRSNFDKTPKVIFDNVLDDSGQAKLKYRLQKSKLMPGRLKQQFRTRVFENGGNFSEDNFSQDLDPFETYVGINHPLDKNPWSYLKIGESYSFDLLSLDNSLEIKPGQSLSVGVYSVDWSWWWERDNNNISRFNSSKHLGAEVSQNNIVTNAKGEAAFQFKPEGYGRYLIRVCDEEGGHCAGKFFYAGDPWRSSNNNKDAATMLFFTAEKSTYNIGEEASITFPSSANGRALISIENGSRVIETKWINTTENQTKYSFQLQPEMVPTAYVHVTLVQSIREKENDLPLRMYGVIPLKVEDPRKKLYPEIQVADVLKPEEKVSFEIKEKNGKAMAYTVAVVDEGLLSLTRFKTPNAADKFLAKEALGVKTWDMYDQVLGRNRGQRERLLAIGGDEDVNKGEDANSVNRFKPVVKHIGPFFLKKDERAKHEFIMPNYVGEVRFMAVALGNESYGNFEKQIPVRKPLMVLATLPRTLGIGEKISLPVNVFAMEDQVKDVNLKLSESSGLVTIINSNSQSLSFLEPGSQLGNFEIQVGDQEGVAIFEVAASGAGETATETIEILIRNPNPYTSDVVFEDVKTGESQALDYSLVGTPGSNSAYMEVSAIPSINLEKRMGYLLRYPYGCIEQTVSAAFPQLYLETFSELNPQQKRRMENNINRAIEKMSNFQQGRGSFSYWPNSSHYYDWASSYAGHFLLEAKSKGYLVSDFMLDKWKKYQGQLAQQWSVRNRKKHEENNQAYRLFTLALAGAPELGAMNRLRETSGLSESTKFRLAAAYVLAGQPEVGRNLVEGEKFDVAPYLEMEHTFGSEVRDEAMILESLLLMGKEDDSNRLALQVARALSSERWLSTQTSSYALLSMAKYVEKYGQSGPFSFEYSLAGGTPTKASSEKPIFTVELPGKDPGNFNVDFKNSSGGVLFTRIVTRGKPLPGSEKAKAKNLEMNIAYTDLEGKPLDVSRLEQGTDFFATVSIDGTGTTYSRFANMALAQIFPGGWEITNARMSAIDRTENNNFRTDYQDIRDDRVYSFFSFYQDQKYPPSITLQLSATYLGKYYLPATNCEAMYNDQIFANSQGNWVEVVGAGEL